jgi:ADP-ribose pyrophosphatase YjhB (NUDIX family)
MLPHRHTPAPGIIARVRASVSAVRDLLSATAPGDDLEARHRAGTLAWLAATDDVFRRVKPATPPRHLVSYVVPIDPDDGAVLLVAHRNAGLWLPPGGHVEPDEHPADTAARELREELGVGGAAAEPVFLTVTETVGVDAGHTDVSLWFTAAVGQGTALTPDAGEFAGVRWWSPAEIAAAGPAGFDPHLGRFLTKLGA